MLEDEIKKKKLKKEHEQNDLIQLRLTRQTHNQCHETKIISYKVN